MTDPKPLSEMELVELDRLADKATPGPWIESDGSSGNHVLAIKVIGKPYLTICRVNAGLLQTANAAYIAACSPDIIKRLISMARK